MSTLRFRTYPATEHSTHAQLYDEDHPEKCCLAPAVVVAAAALRQVIGCPDPNSPQRGCLALGPDQLRACCYRPGAAHSCREGDVQVENEAREQAGCAVDVTIKVRNEAAEQTTTISTPTYSLGCVKVYP